MAKTETTTTATSTDDQTKNRLYNQALREVRDRHITEFEEIVTGLYAAAGLTYKRRLTEEERAAQQISALLAAHPALAAQYAAPVVGEQTPEA